MLLQGFWRLPVGCEWLSKGGTDQRLHIGKTHIKAETQKEDDESGEDVESILVIPSDDAFLLVGSHDADDRDDEDEGPYPGEYQHPEQAGIIATLAHSSGNLRFMFEERLLSRSGLLSPRLRQILSWGVRV